MYMNVNTVERARIMKIAFSDKSLKLNVLITISGMTSSPSAAGWATSMIGSAIVPTSTTEMLAAQLPPIGPREYDVAGGSDRIAAMMALSFAPMLVCFSLVWVVLFLADTGCCESKVNTANSS